MPFIRGNCWNFKSNLYTAAGYRLRYALRRGSAPQLIPTGIQSYYIVSHCLATELFIVRRVNCRLLGGVWMMRSQQTNGSWLNKKQWQNAPQLS